MQWPNYGRNGGCFPRNAAPAGGVTTEAAILTFGAYRNEVAERGSDAELFPKVNREIRTTLRELRRRSKPMGVRVRENGYQSQTAAKFAGRLALAEFLEALAREEKGSDEAFALFLSLMLF